MNLQSLVKECHGRKIFRIVGLGLMTFLLGAGLECPMQAQSTESTAPNRPLKVVLIGSTLIERMQEHGALESMALMVSKDRPLIIRTLAWPADEINIRPRPDAYGDLLEALEREKPDLILAQYGFNESFQGVEVVERFGRDYKEFLLKLRQVPTLSGESPKVIVLTPVAYESGVGPLSEDESGEMQHRLEAYSDEMIRVARSLGLEAHDVFRPTLRMMQQLGRQGAEGEPWTFNGIHLTDHGYDQFSELLFEKITGEQAPQVPEKLRLAVVDKNRQFMRKYRALNAFYIYGGRKQPYGVVNFPKEFEKLDQMVALRDDYVWKLAQGMVVPERVDDSLTVELPEITGERPINEWLSPEEERQAFRMDPRFEVNCFVSEEDFPEFANPIQIRWDARGRLWVSCSESYPQVMPGQEPNDKLLILEDTDGDGRADDLKIFAEGLHIPLSFEFGNGGVFVSEQPHLTFLKDVDGDDRADERKILMTGFGTEDSHHSLHDFIWNPEGRLLFRESIFHHSSVETPYGPVRARESSFFAFDPDTWELDAFGSYVSTNPWGLTYDEWGWRNGSHPVFSSAVDALNPAYPELHVPAGSYMPAYSGTCGQEFIYNPHFPEELQGHFVRVRYKPVNTIELHTWTRDGSGFREERVGHLMQSSNLSFIPVDVRFGPRGALYVCDWYNPVKGHMQYSLRDTRRDKSSGRIWRMTAKGRPLLEPAKVADAPVEMLLENLESDFQRTRYWTRRELRERDPETVAKAVKRWTKTLNAEHPDYWRNLLEGLWTLTGVKVTDWDLLEQLSQAPNPDVRAAAIRALRYQDPEKALSFLENAARDEHPGVRLEAAITASYIGTREAFEATLALLEQPLDSWLTYALRTALDSRTLKPYWENNAGFRLNNEAFSQFLKDSEPKSRGGFVGSRSRDPFDDQNPKVIEIKTLPERMLFDTTRFTVKAGEPVKLILSNPDATPHNLLICAPGTADRVGMAANEMAKLPETLETLNFVPDTPDVLWATAMLLPGEAEILRFHAPLEPGEYTYICSFPGHYLVMRGVMVVE